LCYELELIPDPCY